MGDRAASDDDDIWLGYVAVYASVYLCLFVAHAWSHDTPQRVLGGACVLIAGCTLWIACVTLRGTE